MREKNMKRINKKLIIILLSGFVLMTGCKNNSELNTDKTILSTRKPSLQYRVQHAVVRCPAEEKQAITAKRGMQTEPKEPIYLRCRASIRFRRYKQMRRAINSRNVCRHE